MKRLLAAGTVVAGRVVLDDVEFIDGTQVVVISRNEETAVRLSPAELADFDSHSQALRQARKRQASATGGISTSATSVMPLISPATAPWAAKAITRWLTKGRRLAPMARLIQQCQRFRRVDYRDAFKHAQNPQIVVAGNDQVSPCGKRGGQNIVIVSIAAGARYRLRRDLLAQRKLLCAQAFRGQVPALPVHFFDVGVTKSQRYPYSHGEPLKGLEGRA